MRSSGLGFAYGLNFCSVCWEEGGGQPSLGHGYANPPLPQSLRERRTSPPRKVPASVCSLAWKARRPLTSRHTSQQDGKGWTAKTGLKGTARERRAEGHVQKDTEELLHVGEGEDARPRTSIGTAGLQGASCESPPPQLARQALSSGSRTPAAGALAALPSAP